MSKVKIRAGVVSQELLAPGIYSLWLSAGEIAEQAAAGQFVSVFPEDKSRLLGRPISLCEIDRGRGRLRLVYRVAGAGTMEFSGLKSGDSISVLGPLGNGFPSAEAAGKRALLIGGGIGIPPMLELAKSCAAEKTAVLGYRDALFLKTDFEPYARVVLATEDGSAGTKGNVLDAVCEKNLEADVLFACGPAPMLRAIKSYALEKNLPCWISMEERMACGIGACLACVCRSVEVDSHSHVRNRRVCRDGPVFEAREVEL